MSECEGDKNEYGNYDFDKLRIYAEAYRDMIRHENEVKEK